MNGFYMSIATNNYFVNHLKQRPFVLSRSTFVGSGRYSSHWLGDNFGNFDYMKYSIAGILNFNMFGINHVGADV